MINDNRYWVPDLQHYIPTVCVYYLPHFSPSYVVILLYIYTPDLLHFLYIPYTVCLYGLLSVHLYNVTCFLNYLCIPILHTVCNAPLPPFSPYHFTLANVHIYSIIYIPFCSICTLLLYSDIYWYLYKESKNCDLSYCINKRAVLLESVVSFL